MSEFPQGVTHYKTYHADLFNNFPNGIKACKYCRFCVKDRDSGLDHRYFCLASYEYLYDTNTTGLNCPLKEVANG